MNYRQILPAEPLRRYIRYFWLLENNSADFSFKTFKIMADGLPGMIFQENPNAFSDEANRQLPQLFLYGQTLRQTVNKATENFRNMGVYFEPTALKTLFGIDANELTGQQIDFNDFAKSYLLQNLIEEPKFDKRAELLSAYFLKLAGRRKTESEKVEYAISLLKKCHSLKYIQSDMKISERTLERYFKQYAGISPKLYGRISRFQCTLENLRKASFNNLADVAYQGGYFDQSHFIRDFREFAGTSPKVFMLQANEQVPNFPEWKT